jgi:hypothetical protein
MQKSATLIRKHLNPSRVSLAVLALSSLLFTSRASAQSTLPARFVSQASLSSDVKNAGNNSEVTREESEEAPSIFSVSTYATAGKFLVSIKGNREDRAKVKVTDKHGCVIDRHEVPGHSSLQLGFWYYPGTYQLHITQGGNTQTVKLEKLKEEL